MTQQRKDTPKEHLHEHPCIHTHPHPHGHVHSEEEKLAAVRSAINSTGKVVLKNHLNHCIVEAVEEHDTEAIEKLNQAIDKFMK